jgi:hypothetical protein
VLRDLALPLTLTLEQDSGLVPELRCDSNPPAKDTRMPHGSSVY